VDQESVDTGDERYRAALRLMNTCFLLLLNFSVCEIYPIRPKPELSSKDSVSIVLSLEAWVTIFPLVFGIGSWLFESHNTRWGLASFYFLGS
jgi:hypothetical protein